MSLMSISSIDRKIVDTVKQIEELEKETSDISQFMLSEMKRRLVALNAEKEEMYRAQSKETVSLRIYGETVERGKISNRVLVSVLSGFQSTIDSIATALDGADGERGKFTDRAKQLADFQVSGVFAGSFGIVLEKGYEQIEITNDSSETAVILDNLFSILENSGDSMKLLEAISPYGKRTVNHYKNWLKSLKDNNVNLEVNWQNEKAERRKLDVFQGSIKETIFTLDSISDIEVEDITLHNVKLVGLNIRNNTFEIETENGEVIKGKSKLENLIKLSNMLGNTINAKMTKSTSLTNTNICSVSWYLVGAVEE